MIYRRAVSAAFDERLTWVVDIDFYLAVLTARRAFAFTDEPLVSVTDGAPHQVTAAVASEPRVELFEWFYLYGKWAPPFAIRGARARFLDSLLSRVDCPWRAHAALGLRGRAARLFVIARLLQSRGLLGRIP